MAAMRSLSVSLHGEGLGKLAVVQSGVRVQVRPGDIDLLLDDRSQVVAAHVRDRLRAHPAGLTGHECGEWTR
jgi:hypothetical protein